MHIRCAGQFYVAVNRALSISIAGFIGYIALQLVPTRYYHIIWFNSTYTLYKRIINQLRLIVMNNSNTIIFYGDCLLKMNNSLGFTKLSNHHQLFKNCTASMNKFHFGIALAYNNYETYNRNGCLSNIFHWLENTEHFFREHQIIPEYYIKQIIKNQYTTPNIDMRNLWQVLYDFITTWNILCQV